jgi:uncharacterized protein (TIGR02246 family)
LKQRNVMKLEYLFQIYQTAVAEKDISAYLSIYDEHVRAFDMWQQWTYQGIDAWRQMAEDWFTSLGSNKDIVTFENVQAHDNDGLAVITAIVKFTAVSETGEALRYLQNRLTWVAHKKDGNWKIIHQHTSSPINGKTMEVILQR